MTKFLGKQNKRVRKVLEKMKNRTDNRSKIIHNIKKKEKDVTKSR